MKYKIYLLITLFAVLGLGSCEDMYDHLAEPPQAYEQEDEQSVDGFTFAVGSGLSSPVVLTEEKLTDNVVYEAVNTTATPALAEGATMKFMLQASKTNDFATFVELPSVSSENKSSVNANDLNEAVKSLYGKAPNARQIFIRTTPFIVDGTSSTRLPSSVVLGPVTITPVGPVIETEYYLIGDINGWNIEDLNNFKFDHSGLDVYEDPFFSIIVNNVTGNFKIVPKSSKDAASWDGVIGNPVDRNTELEGDLIIADGQAMQVTEPGWVRITLNMMEYTYTIELIGEMNLTLYVPGGHQNWSPDVAPTLYSRNFDFKYDGFVYFPSANTDFKFTSQPNWDGPNYGNGGDGTLSTDGGAGNLMVSEPGMYKLDADLSGSPFKYTVVKTDWGLIGDATPGGWDTSTPMTYNVQTGVYSVTATLTTGNFKFRANNGWDINMGGSTSNLTFGGSDIPITEAGTYLITLDLSDSSSFKATVTKQ